MGQEEVFGTRKRRKKVEQPKPYQRVYTAPESRIAEGTGGREALAGSQGNWPIGSIFIGNVSTNPATLLGFGTWASPDTATGAWMKIGSASMYIWKRTA